jgi:hypothetical protein
LQLILPSCLLVIHLLLISKLKHFGHVFLLKQARIDSLVIPILLRHNKSRIFTASSQLLPTLHSANGRLLPGPINHVS